ncbi:hypothetical protein C8A00DRAFT_31700 [Chaetomidium leptoderma]|uniref:Uncharacterized protein n=1 Tax=Chaetomidium leptoderma TaxID=669021 RepID=A0AAN6VPK5_9PEZI|nr:hypothetical protein C8A00DRAFT_31700 [Chaetomidium leptoderma]
MSQPAIDKTPNRPGGPDYKAQLDEVAERAKSPPEQQDTGIIDKVSQYVPAVGSMLGRQEKEPEPESEPSLASQNIPGPPDRPTQDTQIEEFLKDQHGSRGIAGTEEPTQT